MVKRAVVQAARLANIRAGPGSVILPAEYVALQVTFGRSNANGHMGARKFVQQNIPRVQFHNPHLKINVTRVDNEQDKKNINVPAIMKVLKQGQLESTVEGIKIRGMHSSDIVQKLIDVTGAKLLPTEAENQ